MYAFATAKRWIQKPAVVYGLTTAATVVPCLGEIWNNPAAGINKPALIAFYLPYLVIPLAVGLRMLFVEDPFPARKRRLPPRKRT